MLRNEDVKIEYNCQMCGSGIPKPKESNSQELCVCGLIKDAHPSKWCSEFKSNSPLQVSSSDEKNVGKVSGEENKTLTQINKIMERDEKNDTSSLPFLTTTHIRSRKWDFWNNYNKLWLSKDDYEKEIQKYQEEIILLENQLVFNEAQNDKAVNDLREDLKVKK